MKRKRLPAVIILSSLVILGTLCAHAQTDPERTSFRKEAEHLSELHGQRLLALSRQALQTVVQEGSTERLHGTLDAKTQASLGVFVTFVKDQKVRGCFGSLEPRGLSLEEMVLEYTHGAARRDNRSQPVAGYEIEEIRIIISLVGPQESIADMSEINILQHGIMVRRGLKSAILLPGEARTRSYLLKAALKKAGIDSTRGLELFRFETVTIEESPHGGK